MPLGLSPPRVLLSIHLSSPLCGFGSLSYCLCRLVTDPKATLPPLHSCTVLPSSHLCLGASLNFSLDSVFPSDYFDHTFLIVLSISFPLGCMPDPPGAALSSVSTPPPPPRFIPGPHKTASFPALLGPSFFPSLSHLPSCLPPLHPHLCLFLLISLSLFISASPSVSPSALSPLTPFRGCLPGAHFLVRFQPPACAQHQGTHSALEASNPQQAHEVAREEGWTSGWLAGEESAHSQ